MSSKRRIVALAGVLILTLGACSDSKDDDTTSTTTGDGGDAMSEQTLEVTATDAGDGSGYKFELAAEVPAGPTTVTLDNTGAEPHHSQFFKLNDGVTMEQLGEKLATGDVAQIVSVGLFNGGTATVDPGATSEADAVVDLTEGSWVLMCFVEGANGPHLANGMLQPFTVTANAEPAEAPTADGEVSLVDFGFELPETITGTETLNVTNKSAAEGHEMNLLRIAEGKTFEDVAAFFASGEAPEGPPPANSVGGMQALLPGASQALKLDLPAGDYIAVCFVPSSDGTPHVAKGMVTQFSVA